MLTSHGILLKYWHDVRYVFSKIQVWYVDRGAPGDISFVEGRDIQMLDAYYFVILPESGAKSIPYHRIRKIMYNGEALWER
jgi:uncharacterized protein (UPF0248 family)